MLDAGVGGALDVVEGDDVFLVVVLQGPQRLVFPVACFLVFYGVGYLQIDAVVALLGNEKFRI